MRFQVLDGWRGLCACFVALFHLKVIAHVYGGHFDGYSYDGGLSLATFVHNSWLFVDFFFVLSGFIITHSLGDRLDSAAAFTAFLIRRFGRLWPVHLVMVAAILGYWFLASPSADGGVVVGGDDHDADEVAASAAAVLALIHALPGGAELGGMDFLDINPPSWSISVEFWIYVGFGALLLAGWARAGGLLLIAIVSAAVLYVAMGQIGGTLGWGLFRCLLGFAVGVLVYRLYRAARQRDWDPARLAWFEPPVTAAVLLFVIAAGPSAWTLAGPLVFGAAVWVFAFEAGAISRLLATAPIRRLGDLSYTVYMTHSLVALVFADGLAWLQHRLGVDYGFTLEMYGEDVSIRSYPSEWAADLGVLVYLGLVVLAASAMSRWVEVPCRTWFNALARRRLAAV